MKIFQFTVSNISYKTSMGAKPLGIRLNKIDGFIRFYGGKFRYLVLFDHGLFGKICDKIKYLINEKCGTTDSTNQNFGQIRIDSYNSLSIEKNRLFIML